MDTIPVPIHPLPGGQSWTAIPGSANLDQDPTDEIVLIREDAQLVIVDAATGQIQFDSAPCGWIDVLAPGWNREGTSTYDLKHGYDVFCDEDGDGIYCVNVLVRTISQYQHELAVIFLDRGAVAAPDMPASRRTLLAPNVSNPLESNTRIDFTLSAAGPAVLRVFDVQGRPVRTLLAKPMPAGEHTVVWDGRNDDGHTLAAGTYFYALEADGERSSRKAVLLRQEGSLRSWIGLPSTAIRPEAGSAGTRSGHELLPCGPGEAPEAHDGRAVPVSQLEAERQFREGGRAGSRRKAARRSPLPGCRGSAGAGISRSP